ncbi:MAG: ATP-binding protein [Caldilineaceae bacterium]
MRHRCTRGDCAGTGLVCACRPRRPAGRTHTGQCHHRPWTRLRREALHDLVAGIVVAQTRRTPLVLAVDDAQWLDEASWALIEALTPALADVSVLLALASRATRHRVRVTRMVDIKLGGLKGARWRRWSRRAGRPG